MAYDRYRATNRRSIATALGVWGLAQILTYSDSGTSQMSSSGLAIVGLVVLPIILAWPWIRSYLWKRTDSVELNLAETRHKTLVSLEIAALSAMLIYLLTQVPL